MRHSGEKPYKCPYCPYSSIQSSTYKIHLKNKHPGKVDKLVFACKNCPFKTVKKGTFLTHLASHKLSTQNEKSRLAKKEVKAEPEAATIAPISTN